MVMPMAARTVRGNLPVELTSFVGRRRELGEVKRLLAHARLVTLTGVGGTGKTRLALRAAAEVRRAFPDGVWFVDLTQLPDPGPLAREVEDSGALACLVMSTLGLHDGGGVPTLRRLTDHLADRQALLVLDNCEHLLPACSVLVETLLRACSALRIVTTGRESLAVAGEVLFAVPSLPAPRPGGRRNLAGVDRYEAVALFATRAQAVEPSFDLTADNRAAVAEICHRLEGLPLAIELAAARIRVLAPEQLLNRLADRFTLLGPGSRGGPARQRTLRACVDWSFDLCSRPERMLWARLSVFVGGFELDAVEGICADEALPAEDLLDLVAGLVDKSVIARDDEGHNEQARYRMLETVRDFGQEQLVQAGEREALRRRHRHWHQQLVTQAATEWISERQAYWMARLIREHPNLRAVVEYCLAEPGQAEAVLYIAVNLPGLYWWSTGLFGEGRRWLDLALAQATAPTALRARALLLNGLMAITQNQAEVGLRLLDEGEILARELDATVEIARAAFMRGQFWLFRGDLPAAIKAFESTRDILSILPQQGSVPSLELRLGQLNALGVAAAMAGDHDRADACFQELLPITEALGEHRYRSNALSGYAMSTWRRGRMKETVTLLESSLRLKQSPGSTDRYGTARSLEVMAWAVADQRQYRRAATLLGAAETLWTEIGASVSTFGYLIGQHEACERQTRAGLGDPAFTDAFTQGQALSYDDAIGYALNQQRQPAKPPPAGTSTPLTRRERQVADLIAQGLPNKEIASALVISQRTAESHVEHILTKLGFTSRGQAAAWVAAEHTDDQVPGPALDRNRTPAVAGLSDTAETSRVRHGELRN
jgi:predicted ATPase/DNA-binding NarL/FixJ family response regulator